MPSKLIEKNKTKYIFYGFNYDKMFKAIFVGFNEDRTHLLCELLSECLDIKIDKIISNQKRCASAKRSVGCARNDGNNRQENGV